MSLDKFVPRREKVLSFISLLSVMRAKRMSKRDRERERERQRERQRDRERERVKEESWIDSI